MIISNINAQKQSVFTNRMSGLTPAEKALYATGRDGIERALASATPNNFSFNDTRQLQYNINLEQALGSAQLVIDTKNSGGKIVTFDLETLGGFKALDFKNNMTPNELGLRAITEFAIHTQHMGKGGQKLGDSVQQMYAFGIDSSQQSEYEIFFNRVRNQPLNQLSSSDRSTLERLSRYSGQDVFSFQNGRYELMKLGDANLDIMAAYRGYQNLSQVGQHQGFGTKLGKQLYNEAIGALRGADVVAGYNISNFDLPVLDEISSMFGLKQAGISTNKVYDVMTALRASMQGKNFSELHRMANHFGIENFNPKRPGSLEALAEAVGRTFQAHYAHSDVSQTEDLGVFAKVFGDNFNLDLPTFTTQKISQIINDPTRMTLTTDNMTGRVIQANRALYSDAKGFDVMKINGERQDISSWSLNRGEYYKVDGLKFIPKDELAKQVGLEEAKKILDYYKNDQGVYAMNFVGASKHNANREAMIIRGSKDEFQEMFARNFSISNVVKSNKAIVGPYDVTQAAIDRATEQAMEDRARRSIVSALRNDGEFSASKLENMYRAFGQIETAMAQQGIKSSKDTFKKVLAGEIGEVNATKILKEFGVNTNQAEKMGLAYGFFKNSHEFMTDVFDQINEQLTTTGVQRVIGKNGNVAKALEEGKQIALTQFMNEFEFGNIRMDMTESNAYTIAIPQFDKNGSVIEGKSYLNVSKVTDGTSQLNNIINNIGKGQGDSMAHAQRIKVLKNIVSDLEGRGLIASGAIPINDAAMPYNIVQSITANLNAQIQGIMNEESLGVKQAIMSNKPINMLSVMDKLDYGEHGLTSDQLGFAYSYLTEKAGGMDGFSLNTAKIRYKNPQNKTQEVAAGIASYFKKNRIDKRGKVTQAVQSAYQNLGLTVKSADDFNQLASVLQSRYNYSESNLNTIKNMLFARDSVDAKTGLKKPMGMVTGYDMSVNFFERDGTLFLGVTDQNRSRRFSNAIMNNRSIDDLKQMGLVVNLPTVDESLGIRTIKTGTVHKGITHKVNLFAPKGMTGDVSAHLKANVVDTVDDALKFWMVGNQSAMRKFNAGDLEKANQSLNSLVTKAVGNAPSLTANQAIRVKGADGKITLKHAVVPNANDMMMNQLVDYGELYNFIPMLYDKDEQIRNQINQMYFEQEGLSESKVLHRIQEWKKDMTRGSQFMRNAGDGGGDTYIKETFMKLLKLGDLPILDKIIEHGANTLDSRTLGIIQTLASAPKMSQVLTESKTKGAYLSLNNPLNQSVYAFFSDIGRANQNAGMNTIQYNPEVFSDLELKELKRQNITLGKRFTTEMDFNKPRLDGFESHITGKLKTMHTHEALQAVNRARSSSQELLAKYGNRFTTEDLNKVLDAYAFNANTYEQRLILNPLLRDTVWADPELIGVKTDGLTEAQLDELVNTERHLKTGDVIGTYKADNLQKQITYDKQVAGRVVSREGNTLYLLPDQRQVAATKLSIGGLEKGMAVAIDLGDAENERLKPLVYDVWKQIYGDAAVIGNPEMGKHMAGGLTVGRYTNTLADAVSGNEVMENKFISVMSKYLPEWNAQFKTNQKGVRTFLINGDPNRASGNVTGLLEMQEEIARLAQDDQDFAKMNQALTKMFKNEEYVTHIARTTNSDQHPANAVKVQRRGRQILGVSGTEGYGQFENGRLKRYGRVIADFEDEALRQTAGYKEGKRMTDSIRTTLHGMTYGNTAETAGKILDVNFGDFAIPTSGLMAEDMNSTFFGVLGSRYQDKFEKAESLRINLGDVSVYNPMNEKYENFIYMPKVMTQVVDGKVYFNKSNKGMADLLTAIEVLKGGAKSGISNLTYEQSLAEINDSYSRMLGQFFDEFTEKDGIFNSMVLEGRIGHSARGLGSNIHAPVLEGMMTGEVGGVKMTPEQVVQGAINEIENGGERKFLKFYDSYTYRNAIKEQADGSLKLYDTVNTSRKQLERMGINFTSLGEQAMDAKNFASTEEMNQFMDLVKAKGLTKEIADEAIEMSQEEIQGVLDDILNEKRKRYDSVTITAKDREQAIEILKGQKISQHRNNYFTQVGEMYAKEIGIFGTNARDPLFLTTSKNVVKVHLDERITDDSWHIFSWLGKKLNQDTDGDATSVTLMMKNGNLLGENHKVIQAARALHEAQADDNLRLYVKDSFDGYLLDSKKTGRVNTETGQLGDDIRQYIQALEATGIEKDELGRLKDNNFQNDQTMMRAIKNRQNKDAIGYLSIPNYGIREAGEAVFGVEGKTSMLESLYHFTDISEQKILDTKHVRDGGKEVTNVTMYRTGVRDLFSEKALSDAELQEQSVQRIIDSFKGPIFAKEGLEIKASDVMGNRDLASIYANASNSEIKAMNSIRSLYRLSQEQEAIDIMNNPFFKSKAWWSNEQKAGALKDAVMGNYSKTHSSELNAKLNALKGGPVIGMDGDSILINKNGRYANDAYRYTGESGVTRQGMSYGVFESIHTGDSVRVYGESDEALRQAVRDNFQTVKVEDTDELTSLLTQNVQNQFIDEATQSYESFMHHKIESEVASEMLYNNGKKSIIDIEDDIRQKVALYNKGEVSEGTVSSIFNRLRSHSGLELNAIADLNNSYFSTAVGENVENFARTVEYMAQNHQVKGNHAAQMIRRFNEEIRERGRAVRDVRANIVRDYTPKNLSFTNAQLNGIEQDSMGVQAFKERQNRVLDLEAIKQRYAKYDIEASRQSMMEDMSYFVDQGVVDEATYRKSFDAIVDEMEIQNSGMQSDIQKQLSGLVNNGDTDLLNWADVNEISTSIPHMEQGEITSAIGALEQSVIAHGDFAGSTIGDLSLDDLRGVMAMDGSRVNSSQQSAFAGTKQQVETYFKALDYSTDETLLSGIDARQTSINYRSLSQEQHQGVLEQINNNIRKMAREQGERNVDVGSAQGTVEKIFTKTNGKIALGVGLAIGAASAISGMQFSASQKNLKAEEDNPYITRAKTASANNSAPIHRSAPASQSTTYLNQDHQYKISARSNGKVNHSYASQTAGRMTGSNQVRVVNSDNRNEISQQWLEQQMIELI